MIHNSKSICSILFLSCLISQTQCYNKYTKDANDKEPEDLRPISLRHLDKPFRMAKLNLLWSKAVHRLTDAKLQSMFGELKLHDKEEITWKHLRAEGKDKDGLKEADLRKRLKAIMMNYDLMDQEEHVHDEKKTYAHKPLNEASDKHINKSLFKDKKLNKLWEKAEIAGFTRQELAALKEEFNHHQDKIDQYYALLTDVKGNPEDFDDNSVDDSLDKYNKIETLEDVKKPNKDYLSQVNMLREHHRNIKDGFDRLQRLSSSGPASKDFIEPKVQGLWKIALESNFTPPELESLRIELLHYENRLLKLRHMQAEHAVNEEKYESKRKINGDKSNGHKMMDDNIKKQARKVEKIHLDLETRIMQKHIEL